MQRFNLTGTPKVIPNEQGDWVKAVEAESELAGVRAGAGKEITRLRQHIEQIKEWQPNIPDSVRTNINKEITDALEGEPPQLRKLISTFPKRMPY